MDPLLVGELSQVLVHLQGLQVSLSLGKESTQKDSELIAPKSKLVQEYLPAGSCKDPRLQRALALEQALVPW